MFITTIHSIDSLEKLKRAKADAVIIGVEHYSIRSSITVKKEDLQLWKKKCKKLGLKLYINFLRLCMDEDLSGVREYFSIFKELDVDGIYYADEGLYYEAKQLGIESKLIYQPETLVASSADVNASSLEMLTSFSPVNALNFCPFAAIASMEEPAD